MNTTNKPSTAKEWYELGNEYRKHCDWSNAIRCYNEAVDLDSDSPAVAAIEMVKNIVGFINKDALNP